MNLTKYCIERPKVVVVVLLLTAIAGGLSYSLLKYELVPRFTSPVIAVFTIYQGASPFEVEETVTIPLEEALASIQKVQGLRSISQENLSIVRLDLSTRKGIDQLILDVERKINSISSQLPDNIQRPSVSRFDFDDLPFMRITASSDMNETRFFEFLKKNVKPELESLSGAGRVDLIGGTETEISILISLPKIIRFNIPLLNVLKALKSSNLDIPSGNITSSDRKISVRSKGSFKSIRELKELIVYETPIGVFRLQDIADVSTKRALKKVISRSNGQETITIEITRQSDANAVDVSKRVKEKLSDLESDFKSNKLDFNIVQDTSQFTLKAARAVMSDLGIAVLLVSIVMLLFLHSLRNSLIVLVSIPTSIIATFVVMYLAGYSLNLMTLLGLSLAIGILVDDSIVVIENIYRHLEMGKNKKDAAYQGRMEIGFTAISITLIDVVVFFPFVFASGLVADLFRPFAIVIVTATLISLLVSFTLVPLLASRLGKLENYASYGYWNRLIGTFERLIKAFNEFLNDLLIYAFRRPYVVIGLSLVLLTLSILLIPARFIGIEFTKAGDRGEFILELELPKYATLDQTEQVALAVERYLSGIPEVKSYVTTIGLGSSGRFSLNTSNLAEILVQLTEKDERDISNRILAREVKQGLQKQLPDVGISPVEINILGLRDNGPIELVMSGNNQQDIYYWARRLVNALDTISGTTEIMAGIDEGNQELQVNLDKNKLDRYQLDEQRVGAALRLAIAGNQVFIFNNGDSLINVNLGVAKGDVDSKDAIERISFPTKKGNVPVKVFAEIQETTGPSRLERTNRSRSITINAQVLGRGGGAVKDDLLASLDKMNFPDDIELSFGGNLKRQKDSFITLGLAFAISIILVYSVLVILYDSYKYPFVVLLSIPLALIGALVVLALAHESLSIFSILGLIMLVGLVGKNVILVVDFTNQLRKKGKQLKDALVEATKLRFRPILMTNISMVIGLLPIALDNEAGSEWKNGLAWALIGGLSSSMILSLIVVPVIYYLVERKNEATMTLIK